MTLKVEGDPYILKMYLHTENEAARAQNIQNLELEFKNTLKMYTIPKMKLLSQAIQKV